jgi:hypothetical protein
MISAGFWLEFSAGLDYAVPAIGSAFLVNLGRHVDIFVLLLNT